MKSAKSIWAAGGLIVLAGWAAYANSFSGPFVYDDVPSIVENSTLRRLWPIGPLLHPPEDGSPVSGRPLANLTFALNYRLGGLNVAGYHAANLALHLLAALALFGIVRLTLERMEEKSGGAKMRREAGLRAPTPLALFAALLWVAHPLQTESVTYLAQRAESLMGLCYLLTLYCFIRGALAQETAPSGEKPNPRKGRASGLWFALAALACFLGMAAKEVMVSAPLIVWLYDRTFLTDSFKSAWRRRRTWYLWLGSSWLPLFYLAAKTGSRSGTAGFGTPVRWWIYAFTQLRAISHYLRLSIWPSPLTIDYGLIHPLAIRHGLVLGGSMAGLVVAAVLVLGLVAMTVWGMWRRSALGYLGAWFFAILAPSSSVVPVATEIIAEHRMYLPLAALTVLVVTGCYRWVRGNGALAMGLAGIVLALIFLTARRNRDYRSDLALWSDAVAKIPENAGAHNNLGNALLRAEKLPAAAGQYSEAVRIDPDFTGARDNLGNALLRMGRVDDAKAQFIALLRMQPENADAHLGLGLALGQTGDWPGAVLQFQRALRVRPGDAMLHSNLASALLRTAQISPAMAEYREALRLRPDWAEAHAHLGLALAQSGRLPEAIAEYRAALRLQPALAEAHLNLGTALLGAGRVAEAANEYREALRLQPGLPEARFDLDLVLRKLGHP